MNLESAAQIGEMLGGLAILFTLIFGLRQISEVNRNRRYEISQTIAASLENALVQRGFSVFANKIHSDTTIEQLSECSREEKDAMNAVLILMSNHAIMTFNRHLSYEIVASFYKGYVPLIAPGVRKSMELIESMYIMIDKIQITEETGFGMFKWVIWLLDRMEEYPIGEDNPHISYKDWKP